MRTFTAILLALLFACAFAAPVRADELGIRFTTSKMQHRVKPEEIADLERRIREVYPACVDTVVAYIGDEGARKYLNTVTIAIQDNLADQGRHGQTAMWRSGTRKDRQSITLFAQMFLTGKRDLKTVVTHELLHVALEFHNDFDDLVGMPTYVGEGLSYHGTNDVMEALKVGLNGWNPELDFDELMKEKSAKRYYSARTFVECFEKVYGEAARKKLVSSIYGGTNWRTAMESASGEEKWTTVRKRTCVCRDDLIKGLLEQADGFREIDKAYKAERYARVIELADRQRADAPESFWMQSIAGKQAIAFAVEFRVDESLATLEEIRTGKFGYTSMDGDAAFRVVRTLASTGRCDEARAKRAEFERFYPNFYKQNWRKDLDDEIAKSCRDSAQRLYGAKKLAHAKQYAEARAAAEDAILKRIEEDGSEKSAGWNRDGRALIASWFAEEEKLDDAAKSYEALIAEFREKAPNERRDLAKVLVEAAGVDEKRESFPTAEAKLVEALTLQRASLGPFDKTIPTTEGKLGLLYAKMGDAEKARERLNKALEDMIGSSKAMSAPRAKAHLDLAGFLKDQGDAAGAL
ncbi:MAG: tetratricopeptide repeat protein, partial [Deltaproteobacteria bacterium]|nr:tetratricopeptide repeat protein [Deltaproteobacteria bacterium]